MGPDTGNVSSDVRSPTGGSVCLLELQLDVDEVVRRPRARVFERQQILVPPAHFAHPLIGQYDLAQGLTDRLLAENAAFLPWADGR